MDADIDREGGPQEQDERRADARTATEFDARLEHPVGMLHGVVVNVSFGGALFVTKTLEPEVEPGARVILEVTRHSEEGHEEISWRGRVVRREHSGDDGPDRIAYAVAFDDAG